MGLIQALTRSYFSLSDRAAQRPGVLGDVQPLFPNEWPPYANRSPQCNCLERRDIPPPRLELLAYYEVKVNGAWVSVPPDKILKTVAPDLGFHVCAF